LLDIRFKFRRPVKWIYTVLFETYIICYPVGSLSCSSYGFTIANLAKRHPKFGAPLMPLCVIFVKNINLIIIVGSTSISLNLGKYV
jgi:hypothetical protein